MAKVQSHAVGTRSAEEVFLEDSDHYPAIRWAGPIQSGSVKPAPTTTNKDRKAAFIRHVVPEIEVMLRVARTLTSRPSDAEDLVQDALLRAFNAIDNFDGQHPRAWLLAIMRNTEINRHRKRRPELLDDPDAADNVVKPASTSFGDPQAGTEVTLDARIAVAIERLKPDFRQVVELIDLDGLTYAEAAELLGVPTGTIMSRVHRGRTQIRKYLRDHGIDLRKDEP